MSDKMQLSSTSVIERNLDVLYTAIENESVFLDIEAGHYFSTNKIGSRIWQILEEPCSVNHICQQLQQQFDVSATSCESEVMLFLHDMLEKGLIKHDEL